MITSQDLKDLLNPFNIPKNIRAQFKIGLAILPFCIGMVIVFVLLLYLSDKF